MNQNSLVQKQITDKNGVSSSRWASPETTSRSPQPALPAPSIPVNRKLTTRKLVSIHDEIMQHLMLDNESSESDTKVEAERSRVWSRNLRAVGEALGNRDGELLLAYEKIVPTELELNDVRYVVDALRRADIQNIDELITPSFMEAAIRMKNTIFKDFQTVGTFDSVLRGLSDSKALADQSILLEFQHPGSEDRIMYFIVERLVSDPDGLKAAMSDAEGISDAVIDGAL